MKKFLIAGNWKMNKNINESEDFIKEIINNFSGEETNVKLLVCPPFTNLSSVNKLIDNKGIYLGAQNCHWEESGAFTGEISLDMLMSVGCRYVIVGHSERRAMFCETDENINKKIHAILRKSLTPVMCIGETLEQRQAGETFDVLTHQLNVGLKDIDAEQIADIVIAYEPVWAIGTGKTATPEQAEEVHKFIRQMISQAAGETVSANIRVLYGGSVKPENVDEIMSKENVDGALVGGASLKADSFARIIKFKK